jgi:hypothetical protein
MAQPDFIPALRDLLTELLDGSTGEAYVLNPGDVGLLRSLAKLSAADASARPTGGGTIASHTDHLRYGFELLNRWAAGENPYTDADWSKSWERATVSDQQWTDLQESLRREAYAGREAIERKRDLSIERPRDLSPVELKGVIGIVVHLAYHMGAIRQIHQATRGPKATD